MFATKLRVASALFFSSFIIWLILIILVAQPTDSLGQVQFSNLTLLSLFLGSAIVASLSSMVIGADLLGLKMKSISLKKKTGLERENFITAEISAHSQKPKAKKPMSRLVKLKGSRTELDEEPILLENKITLPERSLSISEDVSSKKSEENVLSTKEDPFQLEVNLTPQAPEVETPGEPVLEIDTKLSKVKKTTEADSNKISCPKCNNVFTLAVLSLDFAGKNPKMVRSCPKCHSPLENSEDTHSEKIAGNKKPKKRSKDEQKAYFLYGDTSFEGCSYKFGYLGNLPRDKSIPDACFGCSKLVECYQRVTTN